MVGDPDLDDAFNGQIPFMLVCGRDGTSSIDLFKLLMDREGECFRIPQQNFIGVPGKLPIHALFGFDASVSYGSGDLSSFGPVQMTIETIQYLLDGYPHWLNETDERGMTVLQRSCLSLSGATTFMVQKRPEIIHQQIPRQMNDGKLPIHCLCRSNRLEEATSMKIVQYLLEELTEEDDGDICKMVHYAAENKIVSFCKHLLTRYPRYLTLDTQRGLLG